MKWVTTGTVVVGNGLVYKGCYNENQMSDNAGQVQVFCRIRCMVISSRAFSVPDLTFQHRP